MQVLFNEEKITQLLNDFQHFANVRIAVFDREFNELYSCPKDRSSFCYTVRQNEQINQACRHCDRKAFLQAKANNDTYIYKCHLGLYEAITPIYNDQQVIGYVMIGQILSDDPINLQWKALLSKYPKLQDFILPTQDEYMKLRQASINDIGSLVNIMHACATSIWLQHVISVQQLPLIDKITNYLENNYINTLDTPTICTDLNISKTSLYNCLKSEYDMSFSKYLTQIRINHSKELLDQTNHTIGEIASMVGFDDYNYFTKKFKSVAGLTPSKYRKS